MITAKGMSAKGVSLAKRPGKPVPRAGSECRVRNTGERPRPGKALQSGVKSIGRGRQRGPGSSREPGKQRGWSRAS